jgi:hypothetical protein
MRKPGPMAGAIHWSANPHLSAGSLTLSYWGLMHVNAINDLWSIEYIAEFHVSVFFFVGSAQD